MSIPKIVSYSMPQAHEFTPNKTNWPLHTSRAVLLVHELNIKTYVYMIHR